MCPHHLTSVPCQAIISKTAWHMRTMLPEDVARQHVFSNMATWHMCKMLNAQCCWQCVALAYDCTACSQAWPPLLQPPALLAGSAPLSDSSLWLSTRTTMQDALHSCCEAIHPISVFPVCCTWCNFDPSLHKGIEFKERHTAYSAVPAAAYGLMMYLQLSLTCKAVQWVFHRAAA